jgi:hypothetical protein
MSYTHIVTGERIRIIATSHDGHVIAKDTQGNRLYLSPYELASEYRAVKPLTLGR